MRKVGRCTDGDAAELTLGWKGSGTYMGRFVQREGKRPNSAVARWREFANDGTP